MNSFVKLGVFVASWQALKILFATKTQKHKANAKPYSDKLKLIMKVC